MLKPSASEAISPAIEKTRQFLLQPFRLGRFLKLTIVAVLTEGGMSSCNFNMGSHSGKSDGAQVPMHWPVWHWPSMPIIIGISIAVLVMGIPLIILLSYLLVRLRFSYFDCVLRLQDRISPAWARFHRQALRYVGLSLCIGLGFWAILIPLGWTIYQHFKPLFQSIGSDHPPGLLDFLPVLAVVVPVFLVLGLVAYLVETTMSCFMLPHMALEDASISEAFADAWSNIQLEPGQFALFILLRILLSIAATIVAVVALMIPLVILGIIAVVVVLVLKAMSTTIAILLGVPAAILVFGLFFLAAIGMSGCIGTFRRSYALLFYAGRYPALAMVLWPQPPVPAPLAPPPASPPPPTAEAGFAPESAAAV